MSKGKIATMRYRFLKFLMVICLTSVFAFSAKSQFYLDIFANGVSTDSVHLCYGDILDLSATGSATFLMNNNFNNSSLGVGWQTNVTALFNNPCPPITLPASGAVLWFGGNNYPRELITVGYNMVTFSSGCIIEWDMKYGANQNTANCESPDEPTEGVHLYWSNNNGISWTQFTGIDQAPSGAYGSPGYVNGAGGYWTPVPGNAATGPYYTWNHYKNSIPQGAYSANTKFKWYQDLASGNTFDHWGVDNVQITCPTQPFVEWHHLFNGNDTTFWGGMDTTAFNPPPIYNLPTGYHLFIVTLVDLNTGNSKSDTLKVTVHDPQAIVINGGISPEVCIGVPASLTAVGVNVSSYLWSNNATTQTTSVSPIVTTPYSVLGTDIYGCKLYDTLNVFVTPLPVIQTTPDEICIGDTAHLSASGGATYAWSNGGTTATVGVTPSVTTTYQVIVKTDKNCADSAQVIATVNPLPTLTLTPNSTICNGESITITAGGGTQYLWSTTDNTPSITVSPAALTTYSVHVTDDEGCENDASMDVDVIPNPVATITVDMDTICKGEQAILTAQGGTSYSWSDGSTSSVLKAYPVSSTTYSVLVMNTLNGVTCSDTVSATQFVKICNMIYFPTAIVPTGYNREFKPMGEFSKTSSYYWAIYNRWGEKLFETTDTDAYWDGMYKGELVPTGVYVFYFKMVNSINEIYEKTGTVTVLN